MKRYLLYTAVIALLLQSVEGFSLTEDDINAIDENQYKVKAITDSQNDVTGFKFTIPNAKASILVNLPKLSRYIAEHGKTTTTLAVVTASKHLFQSYFGLALTASNRKDRCRSYWSAKREKARYLARWRLYQALENQTLAAITTDDEKEMWLTTRCQGLTPEKMRSPLNKGTLERKIHAAIEKKLDTKIKGQADETANLLSKSKSNIDTYNQSLKESADFTKLMEELFGTNGKEGLVAKVENTAINFRSMAEDKLDLDDRGKSIESTQLPQTSEDKLAKFRRIWQESGCRLKDDNLECTSASPQNLVDLKKKMDSMKDTLISFFNEICNDSNTESVVTNWFKNNTSTTLEKSFNNCLIAKKRSNYSDDAKTLDQLGSAMQQFIKTLNSIHSGR